MTDSYLTPKWVMAMFEDWFDPCPLLEKDDPFFMDGLSDDWNDKTFVNPPYSNPLPWVEKAIEENKKGKTIVMLLNVDTSTRWYSKLNEAGAHFLWFAERLRFSDLPPASKPSMLVVLHGK